MDENIRTEKEIIEYRDEAFDRVSIVRKQAIFENIVNGTKELTPDKLHVFKGIIDKCEKYGIDFNEPISDYDYGYWSGILSALRWVLGDEKDFLDT